jgi:hypothetical protein
MSDTHCRYCRRVFQPAPYHPRQLVCSQPECQRQRRRDYHRHKIASDPVYRQVCLESPRKWRDAHPEYWKQYRQTRPEQVARNRQQQRQRDQKRRLLKLAKSLVSKLENASSPVRLDQSRLLLANNNLARGQVLAFPKVSSSKPSLLVSCQQHSSGVAPGADL